MNETKLILFRALATQRNECLKIAQMCDEQIQKLARELNAEADELTQRARKEHPELATRKSEDAIRGQALIDKMKDEGRYPKGLAQYKDILNYVDTDEAREISRVWNEFFAIDRRLEALYPVPPEFRWGTGAGGLPALRGPVYTQYGTDDTVEL